MTKKDIWFGKWILLEFKSQRQSVLQFEFLFSNHDGPPASILAWALGYMKHLMFLKRS